MTLINRQEYKYPDMTQAEDTGSATGTETNARPEYFNYSLHNFQLNKMYNVERTANNGPDWRVK